MINRTLTFLIASCVLVTTAQAQDTSGTDSAAAATLEGVAVTAQQRLDAALAELDALRDQIAEEKLPMARRLSQLEAELTAVRSEFKEVSRRKDQRVFDITRLTNQNENRDKEITYLSGLLADYLRKFDSRLHIAEVQRYQEQLERALLAPEDSNLSQQGVFEIQSAMLDTSIDRLFDALGGTRFEGRAIDQDGGYTKEGTFVMVGPTAIFQSSDAELLGSVELVMGSAEPVVVPFTLEQHAEVAPTLITANSGTYVFDPTLGNANKIEAVKTTFLDEVRAGGTVMIPIFTLAGFALLVALFKWVSFLFVRKPSRRRINDLLRAVSRNKKDEAQRIAQGIGGATGRMLQSGVKHIEEPRELIEEIMYEDVLTTRLKLQRLLPFIAISAAAAPLLGLLGTVTGIIATFEKITIYGSGDVKMLSGGISEALITTKFGLIVAIPSLLLHAYLSRKARGVLDQMERAAIAFVNEVGKMRHGQHDINSMTLPPTTSSPSPTSTPKTDAASNTPAAAPQPVATSAVTTGERPTTEQVRDILTDLLGDAVRDRSKDGTTAPVGASLDGGSKT